MSSDSVPSLDAPGGGIWSAAEALSRLQSEGPPLRRLESPGPHPLSFAQERLWFLGRAHPDSPADNVCLAWRVEGSVDPAALSASLGALVARHEALRTAFPVHGGRPAAVVGTAETHLKVESLVFASAEAAEAEALRRARQDAAVPFDLLAGPLVRASYYGWSPGAGLLALVVHQIVFDGWSIRLVARDLAETLGAALEGRAPALPPLPVSYTDFAAWQREFVEQSVLTADGDYWTCALGTPYEPLAFPGAPAHPTPAGPASRHRWSLDATSTALLKRFGRAEHATEFTVLLAGLQLLLHRRTGAQDILVFASTAGRIRPELKNVVGLFANVLPLRVDLRGARTFRELVRRSRAAVLGAYAHQELPLLQIVERLRLADESRAHSVFQAMVVFQNAPVPRHERGGLIVTPVDAVDTGASRFPLLLDVADTPSGVAGSLKIRADVFPEGEAARLGADLRHLLSEAAADPDGELPDLPDAPRPSRDARRGDAVPPASTPRRGGAPRDALERQLLSVWEGVFGDETLGVRDNFFDVGGDSFQAVRLLGRIESLTGRSLPLVTLLEAPTVERLAALLRDDGWTPRWSSLVPIRPGGSRPPFFCVHGLGGNVLEFEHLGRYLDPDQPLYGLQAQGLDGRKPRHARVEEMAAHYVSEIRELQPHGPYFLGGSSFGGTVAWEVSQQLRALGEDVGLLVMFDTHGPDFPRLLPTATGLRKKWGDFRYRVELHAGNLVAAKGQRTEYVRVKARRLGRQLFLTSSRRLKAALERWRLPRALRDVREAGERANRNYEPRPYTGRVALLRATEQPYGIVPDRTNGWSALAVGGLEIRDVPGHHGAIMREPRVRLLAEALDNCLRKAQAPSAP